MASQKLIFFIIFLLVITVSAATTCKTRKDCVDFACKNGGPICLGGICFCKEIHAAVAAHDIIEDEKERYYCKVKDDCKNHCFCSACACVDGVCFSIC